MQALEAWRQNHAWTELEGTYRSIRPSCYVVLHPLRQVAAGLYPRSVAGMVLACGNESRFSSVRCYDVYLICMYVCI